MADIVTYSTLITCCGNAGDCDQAQKASGGPSPPLLILSEPITPYAVSACSVRCCDGDDDDDDDMMTTTTTVVMTTTLTMIGLVWSC